MLHLHHANAHGSCPMCSAGCPDLVPGTCSMRSRRPTMRWWRRGPTGRSAPCCPTARCCTPVAATSRCACSRTRRGRPHLYLHRITGSKLLQTLILGLSRAIRMTMPVQASGRGSFSYSPSSCQVAWLHANASFMPDGARHCAHVTPGLHTLKPCMPACCSARARWRTSRRTRATGTTTTSSSTASSRASWSRPATRLVPKPYSYALPSTRPQTFVRPRQADQVLGVLTLALRVSA